LGMIPDIRDYYEKEIRYDGKIWYKNAYK
jgi:hypothetical protein